MARVRRLLFFTIRIIDRGYTAITDGNSYGKEYSIPCAALGWRDHPGYHCFLFILFSPPFRKKSTKVWLVEKRKLGDELRGLTLRVNNLILMNCFCLSVAYILYLIFAIYKTLCRPFISVCTNWSTIFVTVFYGKLNWCTTWNGFEPSNHLSTVNHFTGLTR